GTLPGRRTESCGDSKGRGPLRRRRAHPEGRRAGSRTRDVGSVACNRRGEGEGSGGRLAKPDQGPAERGAAPGEIPLKDEASRHARLKPIAARKYPGAVRTASGSAHPKTRPAARRTLDVPASQPRSSAENRRESCERN